MRSSASEGVLPNKVRGPPPSSFLPAIGAADPTGRSPGAGGGGRRKKVALAGVASLDSLTRPPRSLSPWPAVHGRTPDALDEIERFLASELKELDATTDVPPEVRLQPHREALELFIASFGTYAKPLSAIKRAYEAQIDALKGVLRRKEQDQQAEQAELEQMHERITAGLVAQLEETNKQLSDARWQVKQLQDGDVNDDGEPLSKTASAAPAKKQQPQQQQQQQPSAAGPADGGAGLAAKLGKGGWGAVAQSLGDANPQAKVGRLLKAIERLCSKPQMLTDATGSLAAMLTGAQLAKVNVTSMANLTSKERIELGVAVSGALEPHERGTMLESQLRTLSPAECAGVLEPVIVGLPEAQRSALLPLLVESSKSEDERLQLTRTLLEYRTTSETSKKRIGGGGGGAAAGAPTPSRPVKAGVLDENNLRAIDLGHSDKLLKLLVELWAETGVDRAATLLQLLPGSLRKRACGQILASGAVDALQLEQALELIYNREDEEVVDNPLAYSELSARRRESAKARAMLREGRAPKLVAGGNRVCPADGVEDGVEAASGGVRLTCDCTRQWVIPTTLLGKLKGEKGDSAPPLSIRRFEDARFESVEMQRERNKKKAARPTRETLTKRSTRRGGAPTFERADLLATDDGGLAEAGGKEAWHLSTSALMTVVAELWTEVLADGKLAEARAGLRKLDVAATLWERLLHKHALKSVAQRALADLTSSLQAEAALPGCLGRLRLAAEMVGLGEDEAPWSEAKAHFFFWLLPLCVPQKRMKANLNDPHVQLPLSAVSQLFSLAVKDEVLRATLLERLVAAGRPSTGASALGPSAAPSASITASEQPGAPVAAPTAAAQVFDFAPAAAGAPAPGAIPTWDPPAPSSPASSQQRRHPAAASSRSASLASSQRAPAPAEPLQGTCLLDDVLVVLMDAWSDQLERAAKSSEKKLLRLTSDFDDNGDGVLDFNEFSSLVRNGVGDLSSDMLALYDDVLQKTQVLRKAAADAKAAAEAGNDAAVAAFTLRIPDAIDPAAFAEVVARRTRLVPPGFYVPSKKAAGGDEGDFDGDDSLRGGQKAGKGGAREVGGALTKQVTSNFLQAQGYGRGGGAPVAAVPEHDATEVEIVVSSLSNHFLFSSMVREMLTELAHAMVRLEHGEGTRVITQGEPGDYFYVLVSGHCDALRREEPSSEPRPNETAAQAAARLLNIQSADDTKETAVASYASHDIDRRCFGEKALLQAVPRQASVVTRSQCVLYAMSRRAFRGALRHTRQVDLLGVLRGFGWLGTLPDADLRALRDTMLERTYDDGEVVVREADDADHAYVIIAGFARVTKQREADAEPVELPGYLSQATCFGDTLLERDGKRRATVIAAGQLRCMQLSRKNLELQLDSATLEQGYAQGLQADKDKQWTAKGLKRASVAPAYARLPNEHLP